MVCKNCEHNFEGNFCNQCGQKAAIHRIDAHYLVKEIPNSILQVNKGLLFTVKELFTKPGHSIREFILGKRKQHYKPVAFFLVTSTLYVLSSYLLDRNTYMNEMISGVILGMKENDESSGITVFNWISRNQTYVTLLLLPIFSLATYLAFIKSGFNYFEHLVLNIYITGQQMIIYFLLSFIFFKENLWMITPIIVGVIYNFWVFHQFFNQKKFRTKIGLIALSYTFSILLFFLLLVLMVGVVSVFK